MFKKKEKQKERVKEEKKIFNYDEAKEEYIDMMLNVSRSRNGWITISVISILTVFVSIVSLIYFANRSTVIPYFFEINRDGTVQKLVIGEYEKEYVPSQELIKKTIEDFIYYSRWISSDEVIQNVYIRNSLNISSEKTKEKMKSIYAQEDVMKLLKSGTTRDVSISSITKMGENLYQGSWLETVYAEDGSIINHREKTAMFSIKIVAPKNTNDLAKNPLGITIEDYNLSTSKKENE